MSVEGLVFEKVAYVYTLLPRRFLLGLGPGLLGPGPLGPGPLLFRQQV